MRGWLGLVSLLLALGLVGVLVRRQMAPTSMPVPVPVPQAPTALDATTAPPGPADNAAQQSRQIQQQYRQALEGALQQVRPMPDEK